MTQWLRARKRRRSTPAPVLGLLAVTLVACAFNPATGERSFTGVYTSVELNAFLARGGKILAVYKVGV